MRFLLPQPSLAGNQIHQTQKIMKKVRSKGLGVKAKTSNKKSDVGRNFERHLRETNTLKKCKECEIRAFTVGTA